MIKKRIAAVLAVTAMLVSAIPFSVSAHTNDTYFVVKVSSTTSVSIDSTAQKKREDDQFVYSLVRKGCRWPSPMDCYNMGRQQQ